MASTSPIFAIFPGSTVRRASRGAGLRRRPRVRGGHARSRGPGPEPAAPGPGDRDGHSVGGRSSSAGGSVPPPGDAGGASAGGDAGGASAGADGGGPAAGPPGPGGGGGGPPVGPAEPAGPAGSSAPGVAGGGGTSGIGSPAPTCDESWRPPNLLWSCSPRSRNVTPSASPSRLTDDPASLRNSGSRTVSPSLVNVASRVSSQRRTLSPPPADGSCDPGGVWRG